jgi:hypothetical protein
VSYHTYCFYVCLLSRAELFTCNLVWQALIITIYDFWHYLVAVHMLKFVRSYIVKQEIAVCVIAQLKILLLIKTYHNF